MRDQFPEGERILTSSISFNTHIDFNAAATLIDLINLKCFDFTCPLWSKVVGYGSQTYSSEGADFSNGSGSLTCHSAIVNLKVQSVPPSKIMLGIPTFGWGFIGATRAGEDYKNYGRGRKFCYSELPPSRELDNTAKTCWARGIDNCFVSYDVSATYVLSPPKLGCTIQAREKQKSLSILLFTRSNQITDCL